jgi:hypothetical protein
VSAAFTVLAVHSHAQFVTVVFGAALVFVVLLVLFIAVVVLSSKEEKSVGFVKLNG